MRTLVRQFLACLSIALFSTSNASAASWADVNSPDNIFTYELKTNYIGHDDLENFVQERGVTYCRGTKYQYVWRNGLPPTRTSIHKIPSRPLLGFLPRLWSGGEITRELPAGLKGIHNQTYEKCLIDEIQQLDEVNGQPVHGLEVALYILCGIGVTALGAFYGLAHRALSPYGAPFWARLFGVR